MNDRIKTLYEEAGRLHYQAKAILDEYQGKEMPQEKETEYDRLMDAFDAKIAEAQRLEREAKANEILSESSNRLDPPVSDEAKTNEPAEIKAFNRALIRGVKSLTETERKALRADDDDEGGYLTAPVEIVSEILKGVDDIVAIRGLATIQTVQKGSDGLGVVTLENDLEDLDWTTELATGNEDATKPFGRRELRPHPLAKRIKVSKTLLRRIPRVDSFVRQRIAYKLGVTQEKAYLTGTGAQQPLGLFTADDNGIPTSRDVTYTDTNDKTRSDSLIDCLFTLKEQYQRSSTTRWIFHRDFLKRIRKLRDANEQFLWNMSLGLDGRVRPTVLEVPYISSEFAPNTFSSGKYIAVLGDMRFYWILDSLQMQIQVLTELYAETNQNGYIVRYEGDGQPMLAEAFARLKMA